jgi:hypothetical protein
MNLKTFLFLICAACISFPAFSGDESLYDPVAPEGSAFFRFLNADMDAGAASPKAQGKKYKEVPYTNLTPYYVLPADKIRFSFGDKKIVSDLSAGKFYTVTLYKNQLQALEDKPLKFRAKSLLSFYNMTQKEKITLKLADQDINVIDIVEPGKSGFREVNPVTLDMAAFDETGKNLADLETMTLERGSAYTIAAFEKQKGRVEFKITRNTTDTKH